MPSTEERITALERRAADMDTKLAQVVNKLHQMERDLASVPENMIARLKHAAAHANGDASSYSITRISSEFSASE